MTNPMTVVRIIKYIRLFHICCQKSWMITDIPYHPLLYLPGPEALTRPMIHLAVMKKICHSELKESLVPHSCLPNWSPTTWSPSFPRNRYRAAACQTKLGQACKSLRTIGASKPCPTVRNYKYQQVLQAAGELYSL